MERIKEYDLGVVSEESAIVECNRPNAAWTSSGSIIFDSVLASFREDLPPVLRGLSFEVIILAPTHGLWSSSPPRIHRYHSDVLKVLPRE